MAGTIVLTIYTASLVAQVVRGGVEAVSLPMRRAARSLGMTYFQDIRYVVCPIGLRAVLPAWTGVALGVLKDSALVSVLGYIELLRASQILVTRTQEPFIILAIVSVRKTGFLDLPYKWRILADKSVGNWRRPSYRSLL